MTPPAPTPPPSPRALAERFASEALAAMPLGTTVRSYAIDRDMVCQVLVCRADETFLTAARAAAELAGRAAMAAPSPSPPPEAVPPSTERVPVSPLVRECMRAALATLETAGRGRTQKQMKKSLVTPAGPYKHHHVVKAMAELRATGQVLSDRKRGGYVLPRGKARPVHAVGLSRGISDGLEILGCRGRIDRVGGLSRPLLGRHAMSDEELDAIADRMPLADFVKLGKRVVLRAYPSAVKRHC